MITLFQFPPGFGLPVSVSQYCAKLELYMRLTGRSYHTAKGDPRKSPNKKLPYVQWPDGQIQADSGDIIARLETEGSGLDDDLSDADRTRGSEIQDLAQGPVYFATLYARFVDSNGWHHQKATVEDFVPWVLSPILVPVIRRSQIKLCSENGFADAGGYDATLAALDRIGEAIGDKHFLLGDRPRAADCGVWANLTHVAYTKSDNPGRNAARKNSVLMDYVNRLAERAEIQLPALS